jgi:fluoride exporter
VSTALWIGAGGFLGSIGRYWLGTFVQGSIGDGRFPWGTLAVNVLGCLAIGVLAPWLEHRTVRAFWIVGVLGGFTTFSAFGHETIELVRASDPWLAGAYVGASIVGGVGAVAAGRWLASLV